MNPRSYSADADSVLALSAESASIFGLSPSEADFKTTVPLTEELNAFLLATRDVAGEITRRYDTKMRAKKEAKGQAWQNVRRGTKQATKDRRAAGERPLWDALYYAKILHLMLTEEINQVEETEDLNESLEARLPGLIELASSATSAMDIQEELDEAYAVVRKLEETIQLADQHYEVKVRDKAVRFLAAHANDLRSFIQEETL